MGVVGSRPKFTQISESQALKDPACMQLLVKSRNCIGDAAIQRSKLVVTRPRKCDVQICRLTDAWQLTVRRGSNSISGSNMSRKCVRIKHAGTNSLIAYGPVGWAITPFEGNYYIQKKNLVTNGLRVNYLPGLCVYKFLYVWLDFVAPDGTVIKNLVWKYWLPNPLFPFIWFRVAVLAIDPDIVVEEYECAG